MEKCFKKKSLSLQDVRPSMQMFSRSCAPKKLQMLVHITWITRKFSKVEVSAGTFRLHHSVKVLFFGGPAFEFHMANLLSRAVAQKILFWILIQNFNLPHLTTIFPQGNHSTADESLLSLERNYRTPCRYPQFPSMASALPVLDWCQKKDLLRTQNYKWMVDD